MRSKSKVYFFFNKLAPALRKRTKLKKQIEAIFRLEGKKLGSINYIFCSDRELLKINRQFLHHDYYTDIISFDLSETSSVKAEVYISVDRVRDNSKKMNLPVSFELRRVIFHGALHLCGYNDKGEADRQLMRKKEDYYLARC
jgi:probable rRNA maturation factor